MADIVTTAFLCLRDKFFDKSGSPVPFSLRDKLNTQDDPFDEFLANDVLMNLPGITCEKSTGPLITPDMVLFSNNLLKNENSANDLENDLTKVVAIEVKKLERTNQGSVARASGLDYNTTPPCGRVRVYDSNGQVLDIRSYYLFVCLEQDSQNRNMVVVTALALVDGNLLNEDFELYMSITGERQKRIGLGTYGDGADRARPMLIFANPLGTPELDHTVSLVHARSDLATKVRRLKKAYKITRNVADDGTREFHCYRAEEDLSDSKAPSALVDPFRTPTRDSRTRPRGRFKLPFVV